MSWCRRLSLMLSGGSPPGAGLIDPEEEDLYSVFLARAELMVWTTTSAGRQLLWGMNEAELTAGSDASRIGFVQVWLQVGELERIEVPPPPSPGFPYAPLGVRQGPFESAMVLPALVQCFDDALRRFGTIELSGLQVTAYGLDPGARSPADRLVSGLNWFNLTPDGRADAFIAFDQESGSTPSLPRTLASACRSRCLSGQRAPWGGCSRPSSTERAPGRRTSATSQFE